MSEDDEDLGDLVALRILTQSRADEPLRLLLVKYLTTVDGKVHSVSYRQNGKWSRFSNTKPGGWVFLDDEMCQFVSDYINYLEYCEDIHSLVTPALHDEVLKWFDLHEGNESMPDIRAIYCSENHHFEVHFEPNNRYSIVLRLDTCLWKRTKNSWEFTKSLPTWERIRLSQLTRAAEYHLEMALSSESEQPTSASINRSISHGYGTSFTIIPTMESVLIAAEESGEMNWAIAESVLDISATVELYRNMHGQIAQIAVTTASSRWVRSLGSWTQSELVLDSSTWEAFKIPIAKLADAVYWWDTIGSKLPPGPAPSFENASSLSIAFVTDSDPLECNDFPLLELVRGDVEDGSGASREGRQWVSGHIPVLDFENHMPADEGDNRPWGGRYLQWLDPDTALLAIDFWDHAGPRRSWTDFAAWLEQNST